MLSTWANDTITVLRAPLVESRGGQVRNWAAAEPHQITGCSLQDTASETGDRAGRAQNTQRLADLYLPPGADIQEGDRVSLGDATYELDGAPLRLRSPFGGCDHTLAHLVSWKG